MSQWVFPRGKVHMLVYVVLGAGVIRVLRGGLGGFTHSSLSLEKNFRPPTSDSEYINGRVTSLPKFSMVSGVSDTPAEKNSIPALDRIRYLGGKYSRSPPRPQNPGKKYRPQPETQCTPLVKCQHEISEKTKFLNLYFIMFDSVMKENKRLSLLVQDWKWAVNFRLEPEDSPCRIANNMKQNGITIITIAYKFPEESGANVMHISSPCKAFINIQDNLRENISKGLCDGNMCIQTRAPDMGVGSLGVYTPPPPPAGVRYPPQRKKRAHVWRAPNWA